MNKKFIQHQQVRISSIRENFKKNGERGQTAILSVIFFSILMMVLTVSFMKMVTAAQAAATNNESAASSRAAANSGVEDAKRIVDYCLTNPTNALCKTYVLNATPQTDCTGMMKAFFGQGGPLYQTTDFDSGKSEVKVSNKSSNNFQEFYSCLNVNALPKGFAGNLNSNGKSVVVPLRLVDSGLNPKSPAYIVIQWASTSPLGTGDNAGKNVPNGSSLPTFSDWNSSNSSAGALTPAALRVQSVFVPNSNFSVNDLANSSNAVTVRPSGDTNSPLRNVDFGKVVNFSQNGYNISSWSPSTDPNSSGNIPLASSKSCGAATNDNVGSTYQCYVGFSRTGEFGAMNAAGTNGSYLRLQAIYNSAHFYVTAYDAGGNQLYFYGQQVQVDVTGRSSDAFQRLNSIVSKGDTYNNDNNNWYPDFAIDTNGAVCKQISVTSTSGTDNCVYN